MNLFIEITKFFIYTLCIVLISKYILIKILRRLGKLLNLKPKMVGNIAGVATSIPELLTTSFSAFTGLMTASIYNIISSNIINLIQYLISIILQKNQKIIGNKAIKTDLFVVMLTIIIPVVIIFIGIESNIILIPIFIILLLLFNKTTNNAHKLYMKKTTEAMNEDSNAEIDLGNKENRTFYIILQFILLIVIGIILYVIGNLLSEVLSNLCIVLGIPEIVIGILLGFVTSIPELITFFESQKHYENEKEGVVEATSNLLTSNVMNLCVIQSIAIFINMLFS